MKPLAFLTSSALALLLAGCSEAPPKKKAEEKPAEPVTGRYALNQMYLAARGWSADVEPLRMNSILLPELKAEPGKAAAWEVVFVSPRLGRSRSYTWSAIETAGNLHKGVFAGLEEGWSGARGNVKPFLMAAIKVDSDAAYQTALKKGAEYNKKNPGKPISFVLEANPKFPDVSWRVIWGESVGTSNFSVFVDASTGDYLQTMR